MSFWEIISQSGPVAMLVLILLLVFSLLSWAIIFVKFRSLRVAGKASAQFTEFFWKIRHFETIFQRSKRYQESPLARVFRSGYQELADISQKKNDQGNKDHDFGLEGVEHALRRAVVDELSGFEKLVPFLATVGATSPFIGLFGTVIGIMNSFHQIGASGSASLATVAPGIAESLVATAAGLLAAIPAVMAYNYFTSRIRAMSTELDTFASDFINIVRRLTKT